MFEGMTFGLIHQFVNVLLLPVVLALIFCLAVLFWEVGATISEKFGGLLRLQLQGEKALSDYATVRIDRVDMLTRSGPILGLMGTLIPLGPGLTAMSQGDLTQLSTAISIAFDTTVIGLLIGLGAFILGRFRRRWYEQALDRVSA
ncbi:MAG: hypothetical protein ACI8SR_000192 [Oceanicoccus sp.]|jgi:hypothetical protein